MWLKKCVKFNKQDISSFSNSFINAQRVDALFGSQWFWSGCHSSHFFFSLSKEQTAVFFLWRLYLFIQKKNKKYRIKKRFEDLWGRRLLIRRRIMHILSGSNHACAHFNWLLSHLNTYSEFPGELLSWAVHLSSTHKGQNESFERDSTQTSVCTVNNESCWVQRANWWCAR